ncbi:MAG: hypothetical protein QME59_04820 [Candidatus Hydrothermarchaeota archaeon]|nr:hypothetical protein [Candidatus Hydrothermarchaeota archaeon]
MIWIWIAGIWIFLLILSIAIYKVVQKLARKSYARASRMEFEDVVEEPAEPQIKKRELKETERTIVSKEIAVAEAKPKEEIQKNPLLEYIEEWKEPEAPVAIEPVSKEKAIKEPKRGKIISPAKYPECFGTDYKLEKCKRDCGVAEECIKAVEVLQRM